MGSGVYNRPVAKLIRLEEDSDDRQGGEDVTVTHSDEMP